MKKAIKCGKLFCSQSASVLENMLVLVDGDSIAEVKPCPDQLPEGYEVIDLSDKFVMPGLIDAHVHLGSLGTSEDLNKGIYGLIGDMAFSSMKNAEANLLAGFTTVRDCGGSAFVNVSTRNAVNNGTIVGPRIYASGGSVGSTGGHGDTHYSPYLHSSVATPPADGAVECRRATRYNIKHGADFIKVLATGGVMSRGTEVGAQQMTPDELEAVVEIANMYGVHTAAHAHGTSGIKAAARAGITTIEHGMMLDDEAIDIFLEKGTYQVPTIIAAERIVTCGPEMKLAQWMIDKAQLVLDRHQWGLEEGLKRGVKHCFGTDAGTPSNFHGKQGYEFELMTKYGFTPTQALLCATKVNAEMLQNDKLGAVAPGKYADIVAFSANPLEDIKTMTDCVFVMKGGKVYKS